MVESAIYFPLILLSALFVVCVFVNFYCATALRAHMHILVRSESAAKNGTAEIRIDDENTGDRFRREAEAKRIDLSEGRRFAAACIEAENETTYYGGAPMRRDGLVEVSYGRAYVIDEAEYARIAGALTG
jgi:hypothetical protein